MRTNAEMVNNVLQKIQKLRKRRRVRTAITSVALSGLLVFLVAFSNILPVSANFYANSYKNYLLPYATTQPTAKLTATNAGNDEVPEAALRFIDENNAIVSVNGTAYPCLIQANSTKQFKLTSVAEQDSDEQNNETPAVFHVKFRKNKAELSWKIGGTEIKKILSVAQEKNIPTGLWVTHASQSGNAVPHPVSGGGWTLILENGKSYTGEGRDSAYLSQFLSVNNLLLQAMFDTKSGLILDASVCTYDTTTFDFPTLKERYLSDGDEYYFYSRLASETEKIDFTGGTLNAVGITYSAEDFPINKKELAHESMAKWQLLPNASSETHLLDANAKLNLSANGNALLTVTGDTVFKSKTEGKWYALHHSVLVVLNKNTDLAGRIFTVYTQNAEDELHPTADEMAKYATTSLYSYDFYKIGYHEFHYRATEKDVQIYWGNAWKKEYLIPKLIYEQPYVLNGKYLPSHYDRDPKAPTTLTPIIDNGKITLVFHENQTVTITYLATGETDTFSFKQGEETTHIKLSKEIYVRLNEKVTVQTAFLNACAGYLEYKFNYGTNDGWYTYLIYVFNLIPQA